MVHPNDMTQWGEIACQRGHDRHHTTYKTITLGGSTPYTNFPPIPRDLAPPPFTMTVWDPVMHPVDGGPYCPAHDAVSETIVNLGVWEPRETTVALHAFRSTGALDHGFIDFGAQLGWYSVLALLCDVPVLAVECDEANANLLWENLDRIVTHGDWDLPVEEGEAADPHWYINESRIGPVPPAFPPMAIGGGACLVKIDLEGAERYAIDILRPSLEEGSIDRLLVEISPVFADYYGDLVVELFDMGYDAYLLPPAGEGDASFDGSTDSLEQWELTGSRGDIKERVNSWHQEDVVFIREGIE